MGIMWCCGGDAKQIGKDLGITHMPYNKRGSANFAFDFSQFAYTHIEIYIYCSLCVPIVSLTFTFRSNNPLNGRRSEQFELCYIKIKHKTRFVEKLH